MGEKIKEVKEGFAMLFRGLLLLYLLGLLITAAYFIGLVIFETEESELLTEEITKFEVREFESFRSCRGSVSVYINNMQKIYRDWDYYKIADDIRNRVFLYRIDTGEAESFFLSCNSSNQAHIIEVKHLTSIKEQL